MTQMTNTLGQNEPFIFSAKLYAPACCQRHIRHTFVSKYLKIVAKIRSTCK